MGILITDMKLVHRILFYLKLHLLLDPWHHVTSVIFLRPPLRTPRDLLPEPVHPHKPCLYLYTGPFMPPFTSNPNQSFAHTTRPPTPNNSLPLCKPQPHDSPLSIEGFGTFRQPAAVHDHTLLGFIHYKCCWQRTVPTQKT